jgi:predicted nuclease of predicted toxin-antitoxin system
MKILLDENLDWRLARSLPGHEVKSVSLIGWAGTRNGALLARAALEFDVLVTMDSGMLYQHDLTRLPVAIIALRASSNRLATTALLMPRLLVVLTTLKPGQLVIIES